MTYVEAITRAAANPSTSNDDDRVLATRRPFNHHREKLPMSGSDIWQPTGQKKRLQNLKLLLKSTKHDGLSMGHGMSGIEKWLDSSDYNVALVSSK